MSQIQNLKSLLNSEFEMKDMGVAENTLSIESKRDQVQKKLFLYQKKYIQKVLNCFGMTSAKLVCTPLIASTHLTKLDATQSE